MGKTLVACFSAYGKTLKVGKMLAETIGADFFEIEPAKKYQNVDLDWMSTKSRVVLEMKDPNFRPEIKSKVENFDQYDRIFLGYPIWKFICPQIISTFIESYDFAGKEVYLFCTSDQSGIGKSATDLKDRYPKLNIVSTKRFSISPTPRIIRMWTDTL